MHSKQLSLPILNNEDVTGSVAVANPDDADFAISQHEAFLEREQFRRLTLLPVQTHSVNIRIIESATDIPDLKNTDALISLCPEIPVGIVTADCVPVIISAPDIKGIAAVHAGWKGTLGGIAERCVSELIRLGADPKKMTVAFGPSISADYYEVDHDLAAKFADCGFGMFINYPAAEESRPHLDLQGINAEQLKRLGVREKNIHLSDYCTFSSVDRYGKFLFPSYRRSGGTLSRLLTFIKMK